jgi:hypothetical protein
MKRLVIAALVLIACDKKEKVPEVASCHNEAKHECSEYSAKEFDIGGVAGVKDSCKNVLGGEYSETACMSVGIIGTCERTSTTDFYYDGHKDAVAAIADLCNQRHGKFSQ